MAWKVASLGPDVLLLRLVSWARAAAVTRTAQARMIRRRLGRDRIDDLSDMDVE